MFLDKKLTEEQLTNVVKHSTFRNMKLIPQANYESVTDDLLNRNKGTFMRKGEILVTIMLLSVWLNFLDIKR